MQICSDLHMEQALEFCAADECLDATPITLRNRKVPPDVTERARARSRAKSA